MTEINISSLIEIFEEETAALEKLAETFVAQKEAAVKGDVRQLNLCTKTQGDVYAQITDLEKRRFEAVAPLAEELDMRPEDVTLTLLKEHCHGKLRAKLEQLSVLMNSLSAKVKRSAKLNGMILKKCLELGEKRFKMILGLRKNGEFYGDKGVKRDVGAKSGAVLNKKA
jgi:flagellar biosynthesis/type III secretory pathway chaperone